MDWLFHDADYEYTEFMASLDAEVTLGVPDENGNVILIRPDQDVPLGGKLY